MRSSEAIQQAKCVQPRDKAKEVFLEDRFWNEHDSLLNDLVAKTKDRQKSLRAARLGSIGLESCVVGDRLLEPVTPIPKMPQFA